MSAIKKGVPWRLFDRILNSEVFQESEHAHIHGKHTFLCDAADTEMGDGDALVMAFKTPPGITRAHMVVDFSTKIGGLLELWEGPTWNETTGTPESIIQRFREASPESSVLLENEGQVAFLASDAMIVNPTNFSVATATRLHHIYGWGSQSRGVTDKGEDRDEFPLMPDQTYATRYIALGGNNAGQIFHRWYEHKDQLETDR